MHMFDGARSDVQQRHFSTVLLLLLLLLPRVER
jgi:hypothetical protein